MPIIRGIQGVIEPGDFVRPTFTDSCDGIIAQGVDLEVGKVDGSKIQIAGTEYAKAWGPVSSFILVKKGRRGLTVIEGGSNV